MFHFLLDPVRRRAADRGPSCLALFAAALLLAATATPAGATEMQDGEGDVERGAGIALGGGLGLSVHVFQGLEAIDAPEWQVRAEAGVETGGRETIRGNGTSGMLVGESVELELWALRLGMSVRRYLSSEIYLSAGAIAVRRAFELEEASAAGSARIGARHWSLDVPLKAGIEYGHATGRSFYIESGWIIRQNDETLVLPIGRYSLNYGLPESDWTIGGGISIGFGR